MKHNERKKLDKMILFVCFFSFYLGLLFFIKEGVTLSQSAIYGSISGLVGILIVCCMMLYYQIKEVKVVKRDTGEKK